MIGLMNSETRFSVRQLAKAAAVSVRTLHYYDEIGLLKPVRNPYNGYRQYDRDALLRLQHILFLRELGLSLEEIRAVLDLPNFDLLKSLEEHRSALRLRAARLEQMIQTVDRTILHLKGKVEMENKELFAGFNEETQKEYEEEARQQYGDSELYHESQKRWKSYTKEQKQQIFDEGNRVYQDLVTALPFGAASEEVQRCISRWHQHLRYFYEPPIEVLRGLGVLYNEHPGFKANFDRFDERLAPFMLEAITVYCNKLES